jgi:predicted PurR-regulated permease PerM
MVEANHLQPYPKRVWLAAIVAVASLAGVWLLWLLFKAILVILAGVLLGLFATQLCKRIGQATGFPYWFLITVFIILFAVLLGTVGYLMGTQFAGSIDKFYHELGKARGHLVSHLQSFDWWTRIAGLTGPEQQGGIPPVTQGAVSTAESALYTSFIAFAAFVLILIIGLYSAVQPLLYRRGFLALFPDDVKPRVDEVIDITSNALFRWVIGRLVAMAVIGVGSGIGLWLLGIESPIALATLTAVLNFIPDLGPVLSVIPPMLFAFEQGYMTVLYVFLLYFGLHILDDYILRPLITEHQVSLPPVLTLSCQLIFGILAGFLGLLMAVPITVVIYTLVRELYVRDYLQGRQVARNA